MAEIKQYEENNEFSEPHRYELEFETENYSIGFSIADLHECPEDANLKRDLNFVYKIKDMLKAAYEAGKNSEDFKINNIEKLDE